MDPWGVLAAGGTAAFVVLIAWLVLMACLVVFGLWITYSVIWRAVRRGLREHYGEPGPAALHPPQRTMQAAHVERRRDRRAPAPIRPEAGPRDWSPKGGTLFE